MSDGLLPLPPAPEAGDTSVAGVVDRGLLATVTGDLPLARRCLEDLRARPERRKADLGARLVLLEARVAELDGRPGDAVRLLRPVVVERRLGLTWARWSLADAFVRLGQPDSAAACLERVMTVPFATFEWPFVHCRLSLLYDGTGRIADAERHLAALERAWDRPDPEVRRMLDETRAAVAASRGVERALRPRT